MGVGGQGTGFVQLGSAQPEATSACTAPAAPFALTARRWVEAGRAGTQVSRLRFQLLPKGRVISQATSLSRGQRHPQGQHSSSREGTWRPDPADSGAAWQQQKAALSADKRRSPDPSPEASPSTRLQQTEAKPKAQPNTDSSRGSHPRPWELWGK